jgi:type III restriction enzyme
LKDRRTLVVEYKGSQLLTGSDTREKTAVGKLWEARSGGSCVFRLVSAEDYEAQLRAVAG